MFYGERRFVYVLRRETHKKCLAYGHESLKSMPAALYRHLREHGYKYPRDREFHQRWCSKENRSNISVKKGKGRDATWEIHRRTQRRKCFLMQQNLANSRPSVLAQCGECGDFLSSVMALEEDRNTIQRYLKLRL